MPPKDPGEETNVWASPQPVEVDKPQRRVHRTDWLALLCGLLFIGFGIRYLIPPSPDPVLMVPILLIGLGFAGFIGILSKAIRKR
ncbi:hypothetical protein GCM10009555_093670 [Acrocarpospora macrocephala]|uniref:Uncharacterized protein n=1 Tax=Acrocarpospora macrocephala TaxID=150177 RepID=A0A5M3X1M2_9ACTN|nr:tetraspanin family protein [Acrocarpospora macrocephala]GES14039.1 hypothetical protein Amac_076360 [Acrocarpospora macrocephala]